MHDKCERKNIVAVRENVCTRTVCVLCTQKETATEKRDAATFFFLPSLNYKSIGSDTAAVMRFSFFS